eukprot:snap_masked-scaffold_15-processed-gene-8.53-mRNA-1 protein AED:1.00 eAED:1.00 QI:0/0/0/0/1/1/3/0/431
MKSSYSSIAKAVHLHCLSINQNQKVDYSDLVSTIRSQNGIKKNSIWFPERFVEKFLTQEERKEILKHENKLQSMIKLSMDKGYGVEIARDKSRLAEFYFQLGRFDQSFSLFVSLSNICISTDILLENIFGKIKNCFFMLPLNREKEEGLTRAFEEVLLSGKTLFEKVGRDGILTNVIFEQIKSEFHLVSFLFLFMKADLKSAYEEVKQVDVGLIFGIDATMKELDYVNLNDASFLVAVTVLLAADFGEIQAALGSETTGNDVQTSPTLKALLSEKRTNRDLLKNFMFGNISKVVQLFSELLSDANLFFFGQGKDVAFPRLMNALLPRMLERYCSFYSLVNLEQLFHQAAPIFSKEDILSCFETIIKEKRINFKLDLERGFLVKQEVNIGDVKTQRILMCDRLFISLQQPTSTEPLPVDTSSLTETSMDVST